MVKVCSAVANITVPYLAKGKTMPAISSWIAEPLGDRAILVTCRDETTAQQMALAVNSHRWPGITDVVVAYHSLAIHIDNRRLSLSHFMSELSKLKIKKNDQAGRLHVIPCCYELGEDLAAVAEQLRMKPDEVIEAHSQTTFTVYAIGFSPGFPYLGWLPKQLQGIARRQEPRLRVQPGSIAIVGKQSCIYPQSTPGGWALIGRTPMKLVDVQTGYFPLSVGDRVKFERIAKRDVD